MIVLETRLVTRRFGSLVAVADVSLRVEAGEVVGLLGANGAGKTTLIRLALGLLPPSSGWVTLFGHPPSRTTRSRLGYVPQSLGLYQDLTVDENLAFARQAFARRNDRVDDDVRTAGRTLVRDLSLGLRRRVAFAVALDHRPDLLVLDEPTSGVDPLARARLWETIRSATEAGAGALVSTHHMAEADQCDRLVVLVEGRVAASGTVASIVGQTVTVEVSTPHWEDAYAALEAAGLPLALVGRSVRVPDAEPAQVHAALAAAGVPADLRVVASTFDEAFVAVSRRQRPAAT